MSQSKISSFFRPSRPESEVPCLRSDPISPSSSPVSPPVPPSLDSADLRSKNVNGSDSTSAKVVNKKRSYAQYHLELGQSDFILHHCAVCGMMYSRGDDDDEKAHKLYHKEYCEGITFKRWKNEKVVARFCDNNDRVVLVEDSDLSAHKQKVSQVIITVEKELGFGKGLLLHPHCKVYMYISSHKIAGCLVAEPIKDAHRVISENSIISTFSEDKVISTRSNKTMTFGNFSFAREVFRKCNSDKKTKDGNLNLGAITCEEDAVPAALGFRAIWVVPSRRRKGIASHLMDAARKSYYPGVMVETCKCAFTPPTSDGNALACKYFKTGSFLVYRMDR
ncbi:N-acetyltransferase ESCO2 [Rhynchospora pubera]|uniref:N-acetyltransferase ESCO2 n=1 Tax=Rhynchospora pubera TaxID=906938 RepID=A0AAV8FZ70_9POAL|nr:N-acetyltransferase ESCO2 [Rhynchospora pubera]